ncbi:hypothetical protein Tco_0624403 [Tanacetum coccineum]|uniref:Reverse transcriptase domain-containing protein n=1 Tax=Tanacetum coccineum TaxID=301880 RepID=A0ABQ4WDV0_9ASTR
MLVKDLVANPVGKFWILYWNGLVGHTRALIDCYEKIIRIPLLNGEILKVQGEKPEKDLGSLACIKADEKKLDDIRVVRDFPESEEEHEAHLKTILDLLKKEKLYAKFSKCEFWLQEVQFLGHVVNRDGIHVDPSKVTTERFIEEFIPDVKGPSPSVGQGDDSIWSRTVEKHETNYSTMTGLRCLEQGKKTQAKMITCYEYIFILDLRLKILDSTRAKGFRGSQRPSTENG